MSYNRKPRGANFEAVDERQKMSKYPEQSQDEANDHHEEKPKGKNQNKDNSGSNDIDDDVYVFTRMFQASKRGWRKTCK